MRKMILSILLLLMFTTVYAQENLTPHQEYIKNVARTVGERMCIKNDTFNMCFGKTLQAIAWQESSFGKNKIGDDGTSLGVFQIQLRTAKRVIEEFNLKFYYHFLEDDELLKYKLTHDPWFSARIAGYYLKLNYKYGLSIDHWDPWIFAVSRYNGGNFNRDYLDKIVHKIKNLS